MKTPISRYNEGDRVRLRANSSNETHGPGEIGTVMVDPAGTNPVLVIFDNCMTGCRCDWGKATGYCNGFYEVEGDVLGLDWLGPLPDSRNRFRKIVR